MRRWLVTVALLLTMGAALPAWAGDAEDCGNVATLSKTDPVRAVSACRHLADQGVTFAEYNLGWMYANGQGVSQNYAEALKWYSKAADQGHAKAQYSIGVMYEYGQGVSQDYAEALKWYRKAAGSGYAWAQTNIGVLYEHGRGVQQDYAEAAAWYRKAADQGDSTAHYDLGLLYSYGHGVPLDYVQAYMWLDLATSEGFTDAAKYRERVAAKMTAEQIAKAKSLAAAWKPTTGQ